MLASSPIDQKVLRLDEEERNVRERLERSTNRDDFMVENLDATHAAFLEQGLSPTTISRGRIHDDFLLSEPGGNTFRFNSSHVSRYPV